jgi:hypothetical protein
MGEMGGPVERASLALYSETSEALRDAKKRRLDPALGAGGPQFKSGRPDQILLYHEVTVTQFLHCCIVVQLGNSKKNS